MQLLSLLKKGYIFIFLGFLLLALTVLPFSAFLPASLYWEIRTGLANGAELNFEVGFFVRGSFVEIAVYVDSGDEQIATHLMDPSGNILQQGRVEDSRVFRFGVLNDGHYGLYLKNDNLFGDNDEQILVKVYYYFYRTLFLILGTVVLIPGIASAVHYKLKPEARAGFS